MSALRHISLFLVFVLMCTFLPAQEKEEYQEITKEEWKKVSDGVEYDDFEEKPEPPDIDMDGFQFPEFTGDIVKAIFYLLAIGVIVLIISILIKNIAPSNQEVKLDQLYKKLEDEDDIEQMNLDEYLKQALQHEDYNLAIRVRYLMLLKDLNTAHYIKWSKEKTNGEYIQEVISQKFYYDFRKVTLAFEVAWYGEKKVMKEDYEVILKEFEKLKTVTASNG